jgi:AcrR family transcriptional regulator
MKDGSGTKGRIERAALELFVEQGVKATTIRHIATRAGVAEGALYRHHASKDDLVAALFERHFAAMAGRLAEAAQSAEGIDARLAAMIATFCRLHDDDPVLFGFLLLVQHGQLERIGPDTPSPVAVVRSVLVAAMAVGELPAGDPDLVTAMVMGIVLQVATFKLYGRITSPMMDLAATLSHAALAVTRAEETLP